MLLYKYLATDTRVLREAFYLIDKGFEITVIDISGEKIPTSPVLENEEKIEEISILDIKPEKRAKIGNLLLFWFYSFFTLLHNTPIHIIHAHDLTGLPPAVLYKIVFWNTKIIYDSHELFPEAAKDKIGNIFWLGFLFIEIACGKFINIIIGVSPPQLRILYSRLKKPTFLLLNVPDLKSIAKKVDISSLEYHPRKRNSNNQEFRIVYAGCVQIERGYEKFIQTASILSKIRKNYTFWIVGGGPLLANIKQLVEENGLSDIFVFTDTVEYFELLKIVYDCDIAVGLYTNTINNNIGISNKIFEYMLLGMPFIFSALSTSLPLLKKIDAITVSFPLKPKEIAESILDLEKNPERQARISFRSKKLVMTRLNWQKESKNLGKLYYHLLQI